MYKHNRTYWTPAFEDTPTPVAPPVPPTDPPTPSAPAPPTDTPTPEKLAELARVAEQYKKSAAGLTAEIEMLRKRADLTAAEKTDLEKRLDSLQSQSLTKEELAAQANKKLLKEHTDVIETLQSERNTWQERFTESMIIRTITDAAATNEAFSAEHIVALLRPSTQVVEKKDEAGVSLGFEARVQLDSTNAEGKPVTLDLTVAEAVVKMKELPKHQNLFKGEGFSGLNAGNRGGAIGAVDLVEAARKSPAAYRAARKKSALAKTK